MSKYILLILLTTCTCISAQQINNSDSIYKTNKKTSILLDEVVVKGKVKTIENRGLGNMRINIDQLKVFPLFLGERDIIKTLQFLPGVSAGTEGSSQLNIRGGTNDQTLYLLDGVPMYNQNHTFGLMSIFNSDIIRSVDLYKGGIPSIYGDKLSGVVSVELKDGDYKNYHHSISLGLLAGTVASEGPIIKDRLSYSFAARRSMIDLFYNTIVQLADDNSSGNTMISFYDINGKLSYKINNKNRLSWQIYNGYDNLYGMSIKNDSYTKYKEKYGKGWSSLMTSLRLDSELTSKIALTSLIYTSWLDMFNCRKSSLTSNELNQKLENGNSMLLDEFGSKLIIKHKLTKQNSLSYGLDLTSQLYRPNYSFQKIDNQKTIFNNSYVRLNMLSAYAQDDITIHNWLFSFGARYSIYNNGKTTKALFEPRLKINTFINETNKLMLAYDKMSQPIHSINEQDYNSKNDFGIPFKDNNIPQSEQISLGWKSYLTPNLNISIETYYKAIKNLLLINDLENYLDRNDEFKIGKGYSYGTELMFEYSNKRFTGWISYAYSRSWRKFADNTYPFKYDSPHDISILLSYEVHKGKKYNCTFSLQTRYKSGLPYYVPEISYPSMGLPTMESGYIDIKDKLVAEYVPEYSNIRIKDYFRMDANYTVEKKLKYGSVSWQFSLLNLTNNMNPYAIYKKDNKYKAFVLIPIFPSISVKRCF